MTTTIDLLDRLAPAQAHLPPSARTWARIIRLSRLGLDALELRDPNDGQSPDPADKARHQYAVARGVVFARRLPPAPLDLPEDESPWLDGDAAGRWSLLPLAPLSLLWEWAQVHDISPYATQAVTSIVTRDIHGDGRGRYRAYTMPPAHPIDVWADITSHPDVGHVVPCPVEHCGQHLVWYEAGYVPGYRVCMAPIGASTSYDRYSLRHRFVIVDGGRRSAGRAVLVLDR